MFFKVDEQIFQRVNDYCVGVITAGKLTQPDRLDFLSGYYDAAFLDASQRLKDVDVKTMPGIEKYRKALTALGVNPNKFPCSIEALFRRIQKGNQINSISPLVDLGLAISIKYTFPVGLHAIDSFPGDMEVRFSNDDDVFDEGAHLTGQSEPVYVTGNSVRTRNWLWRQTEAGRSTTSDSKSLLFLIDGFLSDRESIIKARDELELFLKNLFSAETKAGFVCAETPSFEIA